MPDNENYLIKIKVLIMIINEKLLTAYGAELINLTKDEHLFSVDDIPKNYFQVKKGCLKLTSNHGKSNHFIHDFSNSGDPVGETFLFSENLYNINAVALDQFVVYVLSKEKYQELIRANSDVLYNLIKYISDNANYRMMLINKIAYSNPREKIIAVIDHFERLKKQSKSTQYEVPFTRQQLALLTGLRVETVIRTVKIMEFEDLVEIIDGKIFI